MEQDLVPSFSLGSSLTGKQHCFDAWREAVRPFYDVEPLSGVDEGRESVKASLVDNVIVTDVTFSPQSFSHDAGRAENADFLSLQVYRYGRCRGVAADRAFCMRPGEIHVFDFSREFHSVADASAVAGVVIPHDVIGYDPARHPGQMKHTDTTATGGLLINALMSLLSQLPELGKDEASSLMAGFCELLREHLVPGSDDDPKMRKKQVERRADMRAYIERCLGDPDLGVDQLRREFGISEPTIYRDFAGVGGVAHYVTMRRLRRAYCLLLSAAPARGQVQEIAGRCGFDDPFYFSRLFRQGFGVPPSAMLSLDPTGTTPGALPLLANGEPLDEPGMENWLRQIR